MTAFAKVLKAKKDMQNDIGDMSGNSSGDLLKDGNTGLLKTATDMIQGLARKVAVFAAKKAAIIAAGVFLLLIPVMLVLVCFTLMSGLVGAVVGADSDSGEDYSLELLGGDGYTFSSLSASDIDNIINKLWEDYPYDMTSTRETVLRYALSKVGCPYDQNYHGSLTANIFDCSSLAYRSYREVGIKIRNGDAYSAAEECRVLENWGKVVGNSLVPGDLIFYGGKDNGRYKGIYHVAIYVGNGKAVEARNPHMGVVYNDVRSDKVVVCARPTL